MTVFYTSDNHFFHKNVINYCNRPYGSVEEMNEDMVAKWNEVVGPDDDVYHLGDFSLAFRAVEIFTSRLNGNKYLVPGNHDFCHPYHSKSRRQENQEKWIAKYEECGWNVLPIHHHLLVGDRVVNMCHHPYQGDVRHDPKGSRKDGTFDKYYKYRLPDKGDWLICGHVHEKWQIKGKMINVGVDVWGMKPVSINTIKKIMREKSSE